MFQSTTPLTKQSNMGKGGGVKPSPIWLLIFDGPNPQKNSSSTCKHCFEVVKHHRKIKNVRAHNNVCEPFKKLYPRHAQTQDFTEEAASETEKPEHKGFLEDPIPSNQAQRQRHNNMLMPIPSNCDGASSLQYYVEGMTIASKSPTNGTDLSYKNSNTLEFLSSPLCSYSGGTKGVDFLQNAIDLSTIGDSQNSPQDPIIESMNDRHVSKALSGVSNEQKFRNKRMPFEEVCDDSPKGAPAKKIKGEPPNSIHVVTSTKNNCSKQVGRVSDVASIRSAMSESRSDYDAPLPRKTPMPTSPLEDMESKILVIIQREDRPDLRDCVVMPLSSTLQHLMDRVGEDDNPDTSLLARNGDNRKPWIIMNLGEKIPIIEFKELRFSKTKLDDLILSLGLRKDLPLQLYLRYVQFC